MSRAACVLLGAALLSSAVPARSWVNADFETGTLWGPPNGWTVACGGGCVLPPAGVPTMLTCGACPWARCVDASYVVPNTYGALSPVYSGSYSCEVYGACTCGCSAGQWGQVEQTAVVPVTYTNTAVITAWFAANFQSGHFGDAGDCRVQFEVLGAGGGCTGTLANDIYRSDSSQSVAGQNGFYYLPWTSWSSQPLPPSCQVTIRFTAWGCNYCGHGSWGYLDVLSWAPGPYLSPTVSPTVPPATLTFLATSSYSPTISLTATTTLTPSESSTITRTRTNSRTATTTQTSTATRTATVTATPTDTPDPLTYTWQATVSFSETPTNTPTATRTASRTATLTLTATATSTESPTWTSSETDTPTETDTHTATSTVTRTRTPTRTATVTETFIAGSEAAPNPWNPARSPLFLTGLEPRSSFAVYALDGAWITGGEADARGKARLMVQPAQGIYLVRVRSLGRERTLKVSVHYPDL